MVDSNVPMYAAGQEHVYCEPCREILRRILTGHLQAVTNVEVHQEILHRYRSLGLSAKAREVSEDFQAVLPTVLPVTLDDIVLARSLSTTYSSLPARDLVHLAVMLNHNVGTIITADRHFDEVAEVNRLDPLTLLETWQR